VFGVPFSRCGLLRIVECSVQAVGPVHCECFATNYVLCNNMKACATQSQFYVWLKGDSKVAQCNTCVLSHQRPVSWLSRILIAVALMFMDTRSSISRIISPDLPDSPAGCSSSPAVFVLYAADSGEGP